jgi:hypothetical protein
MANKKLMKKMFLISKLLIISTFCFSQVQFGSGNISTTGNITTQNLNPNNGVPSVGSFVRLSLTNQSTATVFVSGSYTGALSLQYTNDGGNTWINFTNANTFSKKESALPVLTIASGNTGGWTTDVTGQTDIRITSLGAVTGTAVITIKAVVAAQQIGLNQPLPTGANTIGAISNTSFSIGNTPNTTPILSNILIPTATTTGDVGAKTATFNGATITNTMAKGVQVVFNIGAVTGTTPTMVCKLQGSADAGTTWYDVPNGSTATLTSTGVYGIMVYPSITTVAGTTTTGTTAAVNAAIPRTWRVVYTIGGTTPSFTLTNVQVVYLP